MGVANPDQTAALGAVWSESTLFVQVWKLRIITVGKVFSWDPGYKNL